MLRPMGSSFCLLYTSDAADERSSVDLGGRRIIKKKKKQDKQHKKTNYKKHSKSTTQRTEMDNNKMDKCTNK